MKACIFSSLKYLSANHRPRVDNHIYSYSYQPYLFHFSYPTLWWIVACTFLEYFELTNSLFIFSNYRGPVFQHALGILKLRHKALLKILNFSRQIVLLKGQTLLFFAPTNVRWTIWSILKCLAIVISIYFPGVYFSWKLWSTKKSVELLSYCPS